MIQQQGRRPSSSSTVIVNRLFPFSLFPSLLTNNNMIDASVWSLLHSTVSAPTRALWWALQGAWSLCASYCIRPVVWISSTSYELFCSYVIGTASWIARTVISYGLYPSLGLFACGAIWTAIERKKRYFFIRQHMLPRGWAGRLLIPKMYQGRRFSEMTEWATTSVMDSVPASERSMVLDVGCGTGVSLAMFVGGRARTAQREALLTETESIERQMRKRERHQKQQQQQQQQQQQRLGVSGVDRGVGSRGESEREQQQQQQQQRRVEKEDKLSDDNDNENNADEDTDSGEETSYEYFSDTDVNKKSNSRESKASREAHGVDASAVMLETCLQSCRRQIAMGGRVVLHEAHASKMPFTENTFDLVFSCNTLHLFPDLLLAFSEWKRCLSADGTIAVAFFPLEEHINSSSMFESAYAMGYFHSHTEAQIKLALSEACGSNYQVTEHYYQEPPGHKRRVLLLAKPVQY